MSKHETWGWVINQTEPVFICFEDGRRAVYRGGYVHEINRDSIHAQPVYWPGISEKSLRINLSPYQDIAWADTIDNITTWQDPWAEDMSPALGVKGNADE